MIVQTYRMLKRFRDDQSAVAMIEFVIVLPFMLFIIFGGIELSNLMLFHQRLDKAAQVAADTVSRYKPATSAAASDEISETKLQNEVYPAVARALGDIADGNNYAVIVTSAGSVNNAGSLKTLWQSAKDGNDRIKNDDVVKSIVNELRPRDVISKDKNEIIAAPIKLPQEQLNLIYSVPATPGSTPPPVLVAEVFALYQPILKDTLQGIANATGLDSVITEKVLVKRVYFMGRRCENMYYLPSKFPVGGASACGAVW